jgi:hypothetical protein
MRDLSQQEMNALGGSWGFLCGVSVVVGIGAAITTGGMMIGGGMLLAEWGCAIDAVAF